jgi:hypothetical protein
MPAPVQCVQWLMCGRGHRLGMSTVLTIPDGCHPGDGACDPCGGVRGGPWLITNTIHGGSRIAHITRYVIHTGLLVHSASTDLAELALSLFITDITHKLNTTGQIATVMITTEGKDMTMIAGADQIMAIAEVIQTMEEIDTTTMIIITTVVKPTRIVTIIMEGIGRVLTSVEIPGRQLTIAGASNMATGILILNHRQSGMRLSKTGLPPTTEVHPMVAHSENFSRNNVRI